ncbi:MAG: NAD(P)H-binding protein [Solirubrobacterales bacterium]|nr:NAD(P)H-binding protein [Solirubrobacterales bacterium]
MTTTVLVIGATGTVGGATLEALRASGVEPVAFVRDARRAATVLGDETPFCVGDLADEGSVRAALDGQEAVLLCSAHGPGMREHQLAAVRAIETSDVNRVVKISGSPHTRLRHPDAPNARGRARPAHRLLQRLTRTWHHHRADSRRRRDLAHLERSIQGDARLPGRLDHLCRGGAPEPALLAQAERRGRGSARISRGVSQALDELAVERLSSPTSPN